MWPLNTSAPYLRLIGLGPLRTRKSLATQATKIAGSGRFSEFQYVMMPERGALAVNRVTTFDDGDVIGWEPTH